jgi:glycosyltransferase involved in cell wall biosynthesis
MLLTIYILSYNAPEKVNRILDSLLPWESGQTEIIVGDNSADDRVVRLVERRQAEFGGQLRCLRHVCNVGYNGNMLRSFEVADGRYLWIVGCGDRFLPGAVKKVESVIACLDDAVILFPVNGLKQRPWPLERVYRDVLELVEEIELGPLTSINSCVYRVECARKCLVAAYEGASNLIPQTTIIAALLKDGHQFRFYPHQVFERLPSGPRKWDPRCFWMNLWLIYPRVEDRILWNRLRRPIIRDWSRWVRNMENEGYPITWPMVTATWFQFGMCSLPLILRLLWAIARRKAARPESKRTSV